MNRTEAEPWDIVLMQSPLRAASAALRLLAVDKTFARYKLGHLVETIVSTAQREHIFFARSGGKLCGFVCWGLTQDHLAERWVRTGEPPAEGDGLTGDVVVLLMAVARRPNILRGGMRHLGRLYPGKRFVFLRAGKQGRHSGRFPDPANAARARFEKASRR